MASVSLIFLGCTLFHTAQRIAQVVQFHADRFLARQFVVTIACEADEGLPDSGSAQTSIQARTLKTWIGLALAVHNIPDIRQQIRQMLLRSLAPACCIAIQTRYPTEEFMRPFADRIPVPAQLPLGL